MGRKQVRARWTAFLVAACVIAAATPAAGQVLTGRVVEFDGERPVPAADLRVIPETQETQLASATADSQGRFSIATDHLADGMYRLRVSALGYEEVVTPAFRLSPTDSVDVEVSVSPNAVPLAPLAVLVSGPPRNSMRLEAAGYFTRKKDWGPEGSDLAHFLDPEDLNRMPLSNRLSDYLRDLRGVYLGGGGGSSQTIEMRSTTSFSRSRCTPALYVDGHLLRIDKTGERIDKMISPPPSAPSRYTRRSASRRSSDTCRNSPAVRS